MNTIIRYAFFLVLVIFPSFFASSQPFEEGPASEKIQQLRRVKLIEALDLGEEQAIRFFVRENEFQKSQKEVAEKRDKAIQSLHEFIKSDADDATLLKAISEVQKYDEQFQNKRYEFMAGLKDILEVEQIAKLVVFEQRFKREIREILHSLRENRPPPRKRR